MPEYDPPENNLPESDTPPPEMDGDVPFHLPMADDLDPTDNIHKADTEEIDVPVEGTENVEETTDHPMPRTEGMAAIPPEDEPMFYGTMESQAEEDPTAETIEHRADYEHEASYDDDDDVPFRLPKSDDLTTQNTSPIGNKWVTMPHTPSRSSPETLPGSGGLDPNPDMVQHTVPSSAAKAQPTIPAPPQQAATGHADHQRFRRPVGTPPQQRPNVPPPPGRTAKPMPNPLPRRRRRRRPRLGCMAIALGLLLTFCGGTTLLTLVGGAFAYARVGDLLNERIDAVDEYTSFQSTFLYDRNGEELFEIFGEGRRQNVRLRAMPQHLIDATIAIEDDSFYRNIGIDVGATTVAMINYFRSSPEENTPGGSTITQQIVRNVLFDPEYRAERSVQRKAEEILLALALNGRKGKDEILELYLNEIYYGNLAYGAQAASQVFFGKDVGELTLGEAALLAGLPQAPSELDPLNPDPAVQAAVEARWRQVLNEMVEERFITNEQRNEALRAGLAFSSPDVPLNAPHFTVYAQGQLENLMRDLGYSPEEIARGGLHVYTTVDLELNRVAQQIAAAQVARLSGNNISNAAVIVTKPITGEILAMVGSIDYNNDAIDGRVNVTIALRQPGSTMKPFTYSAAIERGITPGDVIWDTRTSIGIPGQEAYVPRNYDSSFHGPMAMRYALANSFNIPAVQTLRQVGVDYLLELMQRFGAESLGTDAARYGLSLTLGGGEISPIELTQAYSVFANDGVLVETNAILCILDNDDNIIYEFEGYCPRGNTTGQTFADTALGTQVLDPRIAFIISDILNDNQARTPAMGANSPLYTPNIVTSVKTGTTNDVKDNWTVGYTSNVAVGVWVGNNNGDPMVNTSGLTGAAPIWNEVMTTIYNNSRYLNHFSADGRLQPDQLSAPDGTVLREICNVRTLRDPATSCPSTINEWFLASPAGLPDGQGGLYYPAANNAPAEQQPTSGSYVQEVSPGVYRSAVYRLDPAIAQAIQFNTPPGERRPPAPLYCRVPVELIPSTPGVQEQLFIAPPPVSADAAEAEEYARSHELAFLPTIDCSASLLVPSSNNYVTNATAIVSSPQPNAVISGPTAIIGTAEFSSYPNGYYKIDIIGGQFTGWTTIGPVHNNSVVNGQLETLPALPTGSYRMRLVIDNLNGQSVPPYEVPFSVP